MMFILMLLCAVTRVYTSQMFDCDNGWTLHKDNCYFFSDTDGVKKTGNDALTYCHDNDSYLVAVTDADINDFLYNNRIHGDFYWIGLRPFALNKWGWNDGSVADDISWGNSDPNDNSPCVRIKDNLFFDRACINNYKAICERDTQPNVAGDWTSHGDHWYILTDKMSHLAAVKACSSQGGYLARLTSAWERNLEIIPANKFVWTGLTRLVWDGGSGYNWHFWRGENNNEHPNNTGCAALGKGTGSWKLKDCEENNYFICNREPSVIVPPTTSASPTTEEITTEHYTMSTKAMRRTDVSPQTSTLSINGTIYTESQISSVNKVLQYVLFAIYAMIVLMLFVDSVLLVIFIKLRKSFRTQFDEKSQASEADSAAFDNHAYADVQDYIPQTEPSNAPIYSVPHKSSIHV